MRTLLAITGIFLLLYSSIYLATVMSIVSASEEVLRYRVYVYLVVVIQAALGFYFIWTAKLIKKKKTNKRLISSLVNLLRYNKFKVPVAQYAMANKMYIEEAEKFITKNKNHFSGTLTIDKNDMINYNYKKLA